MQTIDQTAFFELKKSMIMMSKDFTCPITKNILDVGTSSIYQFFSRKTFKWVDVVLDDSHNKKSRTLRKVKNFDDFLSNRIKEYVYNDARDNYMGWCAFCANFTTDECEPDAENRECELCKNKIVVGAENAILMDLIEIME